MRGYVLVVAVLVGTALLLFAAVEGAALPILTDPVPVMRGAGGYAALIGVSLLTVDVLVPVPSSWVMVAHGALFGVLPGAGLSVVGGTGATVAGLLLGRWGRRAVDRATTPTQRERAGRFLARWGVAAVVITRPVPVLAETVAVLAGTSGMRWPVAACAGAAGTAAPAFAYAAAGASGSSAIQAVLGFGLVLTGCLLLLALADELPRIGRLTRQRSGARVHRSGGRHLG